MLKFYRPAFSGQPGQTLIETLAAAFILVMGITAAVGLAIYVFGSSTNIIKQIIATGLAREGVEAVKNMRDTNWLQDSLSTNCWDFASSSNSGNCYKNWLKSYYGIDPAGATKSYSLTVDPSNTKLWSLNAVANGRFGLNRNTDTSYINSSAFAGLYTPETTKQDGNSEYYREIVLSTDSSAPYSQSEYPKLKIQSRVWWVDKKCPRVQTYIAASSACKVEIQMYLTNWKNY